MNNTKMSGIFNKTIINRFDKSKINIISDFDCPPKKMRLDNLARTKYGSSLEIQSLPKDTKTNSVVTTQRKSTTEDHFMKVQVQNKRKEINIRATNFKFNLPGVQKMLKKIPTRVL